jgi:DNA polymerase-3 subunit beta
MSGIMFSTTKRDLAAGLAWAAKGLPKRPVLPVLGGMRLQASLGRVSLAGFDYDGTCKAHVPADVTTAGVILPDGADLVRAVKSLPGKPGSTVLATSDGDTLTLECEGASASVRLLDLAGYPTLPVVPAGAAQFDGEAFATAVARIAPCAGTDDTLPVLLCARFAFTAAGIELAATNRYALAVGDLAATVTGEGMDGRAVLVPAKMLAAYAKVADKSGKVTIHAGDPRKDTMWFAFTDGQRGWISRGYEGSFPPVHHLLPAETPATAVANAPALLAAVKRAGAATGKSEPVKLVFERERVTVTGTRDGVDSTREVVPCTLTGTVGDTDTFTLGFNATHLTGVLSAAGGPVRIGPTKLHGLVTFTPDDATPWRGAIMTIKLGD